MMKDVSLVASLSRLVVVALLMAGVLLLLRKTTKRGGATPKRGPKRAIELVDRQSLGKTQSIAVLRVHGCTLVVGVTEQRVEMLTLLEHPAPELDLDDDGNEMIDLAEIELARSSASGTSLSTDDGVDQFFERLRRRSAR
jgi:flagellar biogenesis protein FliO